MKDIKFRVYFEFELDGVLHKGIEEEASWFLLTQTGKLLSYGPFKPPTECEQEYKKLIPLFYTGKNDINNKEIFQGDIVIVFRTDSYRDYEAEVYFSEGCYGTRWYSPTAEKYVFEPLYNYDNEVIGNVFENADLLKK